MILEGPWTIQSGVPDYEQLYSGATEVEIDDDSGWIHFVADGVIRHSNAPFILTPWKKPTPPVPPTQIK